MSQAVSPFRFNTARRVRPTEGVSSCGDAVIEVHDGAWHLFAVVDALGHGPDAEKSAEQACGAVETTKGQPLARVFEAVHKSLHGQRGAVMSALLVHGEEATFAGVGNVELFAPEGVPRPVTMAGTLGGASYRFRSFALPLRAGQRWLLASDGIKVREASVLLSQLRPQRPELVAESLMLHATRGHDDASLLVLDVEAP